MKGDIPLFETEKRPMQFQNVTEANAVRDSLAGKNWISITIAAPRHYNLDNN
jgi:hypothetical protein